MSRESVDSFLSRLESQGKTKLTIETYRRCLERLPTEYEKSLPEFSLRLQAKVGLTGYAQAYGKYNAMPYEKLLMDLQYMAHSGMLADLKIIFATIKVLFVSESTEGVSAETTIALDTPKSDYNEDMADV